MIRKMTGKSLEGDYLSYRRVGDDKILRDILEDLEKRVRW